MTEEKTRTELTPEQERENTQAVLAHILPFAIWLTIMVWFDSYNARTLGGLLLLAIFRPWRWYPRLQLKNILPAIGVGLFILLIWVGFETPWFIEHFPKIAEWYDRLFVDLSAPLKTRELFDAGGGNMVPYEVIEAGKPHAGLHPFSPEVTGWPAFWVHMFGTSIIIAVIEEFFFRGFVYRWMLGSPFFEIDPGKLHWPMLLLVSLFFGVEHREWLAGIICGISFGLLYIKTKDIWAAIIAHATTNFLLGLYVIKFGAYQFW
jgi:membrane protease YdiL (CAAX protease family)